MEKGTIVKRLTLLGISEQRPVGKKQKLNWYEKCKCICGNEIWVLRYQLTTKGRGVQSCGCLRREVGTINQEIKKGIRKRQISRIIKPRSYHHMTNTSEYITFVNIKSRCNYKKAVNYRYYGGRGIKCLWKDFNQFYTDMGKKPGKEYTIERIDNDGNYCKENCKRATMKEQSLNKRNNTK